MSNGLAQTPVLSKASFSLLPLSVSQFASWPACCVLLISWVTWQSHDNITTSNYEWFLINLSSSRPPPSPTPPPHPRPVPPFAPSPPLSSPGCISHRFVGLVVKVPASRAEDPGFNSHLRRGAFFGSRHTRDLKISTPVAALPGDWRYRVSAGTGWPGVNLLWLDETESLICNCYLRVAARALVCADLSLRYTSMLLGR